MPSKVAQRASSAVFVSNEVRRFGGRALGTRVGVVTTSQELREGRNRSLIIGTDGR